MEESIFDKELEDTEGLLTRYTLKDEQLQDLLDSTEVEVEEDPSEAENRDHKLQPKTYSTSSIFGDPDAHPMVLALLLMERYEREWLTWDVEVVTDEITTMFGEPHPSSLSKVMAAQICYTKSAPWEEWHLFVLVCQAFNGIPVDPESYRPPTVAEAAICCQMMHIIDDKNPWAEEVLLFLQAVLAFHQFLFSPEELEHVPPPVNVPPFDKSKVASIRKNPSLADDTVEGFFGLRLHDFDLEMAKMRKHLREQLRLVKRT